MGVTEAGYPSRYAAEVAGKPAVSEFIMAMYFRLGSEIPDRR